MINRVFFCGTLISCRGDYTLFVQAGAETSSNGWAGPRLFLEMSFQVGRCRCRECNCGVLWGFPPLSDSIDPLSTNFFLGVKDVSIVFTWFSGADFQTAVSFSPSGRVFLLRCTHYSDKLSLGGFYYKMMKWYFMKTIAYLFFGSNNNKPDRWV